MKKIIIAAGGTGGHLYPGICLARSLREIGVEVIFIVKKGDICIPLLKESNFNYFTLKIIGMPRTLSVRFVFFVIKMFFATLKSLLLIKKEKPGVIAGFGGYISFPAVFAAKILGIPSVIHEQNIIPGLTNKFLSNIADKIAISFPGWNAKKTILTGNPVRPEIKGISKHEGIDKINAMNGDFSLREEIFTILVFGGSQGSSTVNTGIASCLERMEPLRNEFQLIHISGEKDFIWLKKIYEVKKYNAVVFPYIHSMGFAYACADLVICRSGAMTVAELIALKKPAILIPYRYSTNAHQEYNARFLQERGAAILIREEEFECDRIINTLTNIIKNPSQLSSMKKVLSEIEIEDSGKKLAKIITDLLY